MRKAKRTTDTSDTESTVQVRFSLPGGVMFFGPRPIKDPGTYYFETPEGRWSLILKGGLASQFEHEVKELNHALYIPSVGIEFVLSCPRRTTTKRLEYSVVEKALSIANRVANGFRFFLPAANVNAYSLSSRVDNNTLLRAWKVELRRQNKSWTRLRDELPFFMETPELAFKFAKQLKRLNAVIEAIDEQLLPRPEQEFTINAEEHRSEGNLRYAVLEAAIALEISIARLLTTYIRVNGNASTERINTLLQPTLGLRQRVELLRIFLPKEIPTDVKWPSVISLINVRNKIMHTNGKIPSDTDLKELSESVAVTCYVAKRVGQRAYDWENHSWRTELRECIRAHCSCTFISKLEHLPRHRILLELKKNNMASHLSKGPLPTVEDMIAEVKVLVQTMTDEMAKHDKFFITIRHLKIVVKDFLNDNELMVYIGGKISVLTRQ